MEEEELREWAGELMKLITRHCCCGAPYAPLLRLKVTELLRTWAYAIVQVQLPPIPSVGELLPELPDDLGELPQLPDDLGELPEQRL